jgi:tetratricopeptide (TPR) repeat protein
MDSQDEIYFHGVIFSLPVSGPVTGISIAGESWTATRVTNTAAIRSARWLRAAGSIVVQLAAVFALAEVQHPAAGCAAARPYIDRAQAASEKGDSASSLAELQQATKINPRCAEAYLLMGLTEFQRGTIDDAIAHYQRALALQPRSYSGHYNLALAYLKQHKWEEGRAQLAQAVKLDSHKADAAYDLGIVLLELGKPAEALAALRRAKMLNPKRSDVAFNLIRAELEAGQGQQARFEAEQAAKDFRSDPQWHAAIGELFLKKDQPKDAASYLAQASHLRPNDLGIRHMLAVAYLQSGQPQAVLRLITEPKTVDDYFLRASAYYESHQFPEADRESQVALNLAPENPQVLVLRTRLLQRAGEQDAAVATAKKAIALAAQWDEPYYLAGVSYYFIRHYAEAQASLARAVALNPRSARALFVESIALANLGKIDEAEGCLRRAIVLQPKNARLYCHLGILLARRNQNTHAEESFRRAIELKPDYGLSHYELGKLLAISKQLRPAAQELEEAVMYDPGLSAAYYQLARIYAKLGNSGKSQHMLAEFERLRQQEAQDSRPVDQAREEDARKGMEAP